MAATTQLPERAPGVTVRPLVDSDVGFMVRGHREQLPPGFFVRLGPRFLGRYHRCFVESPHAVALLVEVDGRPAGALVGTTRHRAHYQWLLRRRAARLAVVGGLALLRRPRELGRFGRERLGRYLRAAPRIATTADDGSLRSTSSAGGPSERGAARDPRRQVAVLHHMFVVPQHRHLGLGGSLVETFEELASASGATEARLVTLAGAGGAERFYRRLGWRRRARRRDRERRRITEMVRDLRDVRA